MSLLSESYQEIYHPAVNFLYFALVIVYSVILLHPFCLGISLCCAFAYSLRLNGRRAWRFNLLYLLPLLLLCALLNPAFNHEGNTVLFYLYNGRPVTAESVYYGLASAAMLVTAICWFSCYNLVMTTDKFVYLFGRVIPSLSLVLSLALRMIPRFREQTKVVINAQRCLGRASGEGKRLSRAKQGLRVFSILMTWALENAIQTADSMRARGYGLPGRTTFSIYRWERRDWLALSLILLAGAYVLLGLLCGGLSYSYYPSLQLGGFGLYSCSVFGAYLLLCALPLGIELLEQLAWRRAAKLPEDC